MSAAGWVEPWRNPFCAPAGTAVHLGRAGYDAEGIDGLCRGEGGLSGTPVPPPLRGATRRSIPPLSVLDCFASLAMNNAWAMTKGFEGRAGLCG
jgi:hypothetical protein